MFERRIVKHADIRQPELDEIIGLKSIAWPYPYDRQLDWIRKNLRDDDLHLLLYKSEIAIGYLNLRSIDIAINTTVVRAFGVGNVCVKDRGKGYGKELMIQSNELIKKSGNVGLLFCKQHFVEFYQKVDWILIDRKKVNIRTDNRIVHTMIYNHYAFVNELEYAGNLF